MMQETKISVIMPVYNAAKYIRETVGYVQKQTLRDIEIICVDDGSDDNTAGILDEIAAGDGRVRVIRSKHSTAGNARNKGMEIAAGKYFSFLDADDIFKEDMLERAYKKAEKCRADIVAFRSDRKNEATGRYEGADWTIRQELIPRKEVFSHRDIDNFYYCFSGFPWDKLFRRSFIEDCGLHFQDQPSINDQYFVFSALTKAERICIIDNILAHKRINNKDSISSEYINKKENWPCFFHALLGIKNQLEAWGLYEEMKKHYVNYASYYTLWNLKRFMPAEDFEEFYKLVIEEYLPQLDVCGQGGEMFFRKIDYDELRMLKNMGCQDFRKYNIMRRRDGGFVFPFGLIPGGSKVALYGAGAVGRVFHSQLQESGYCQLTMWVDRNWEKCGQGIQPVEDLLLGEYDYLVLANNDEFIAKDIKQSLIDMGIDEGKIIWRKPDKEVVRMDLNELAKKPKVSVILPSLNVANYIRQCLESVVSQTLKNIEIICVDAGSTDGTLEIIREFAAKDSRIKVILSEKKSYGHQMNLGVNCAQGKYIGIVETDDYVPAEMYEELYEIAEANRVDFVKADFYRFTGEGENLKKNLNRLTHGKKQFYNRVIDVSEERECFKFVMNTWSGIYSRDFLNRHHIRHNDTPGASYQDNGFWFQTLAYAKRAYFVDKPYYMNRRDNPNSSVFNSDKVFIICEEYERLLDTLKQDKEVFESFKCEYAYFAFRNYCWTLDRILMKDKPRFFEKIKSFCREMREQDMLDYKVFARYEEIHAFDLHAIETEPDLFYERMYTLKQEIIEGLLSKDSIIIYGAGGVGQMCCDNLMNEGLGEKLAGFAVSGSESGSVKGLPVRSINDWMDYKSQGTVIVAVSPKYKGEINAELVKRGFQDIVFWPDSTYMRGEEFSLNVGSFDKDLSRGWVFPYTKVKKGSRVVLYGAYEVGQSYFHQLQVTGYAQVVKWVDDDELWLHKSLSVESIECLKGIEFDYVVVAWSNRRNFKNAMWNLLNLGVPYECIVWKEEEKLLDDVYTNSMLRPVETELQQHMDRQIKELENRKEEIEKLRSTAKESSFALPEMTVRMTGRPEDILGDIDGIMETVGTCMILELMSEDIFAYEGLENVLGHICSNDSIMHVRLLTQEGDTPSLLLCYILKNNFVEVHVYHKDGNSSTNLTDMLKRYGIDCRDVFPEVRLERSAGREEKIKIVLNKSRLCTCSEENLWQEKEDGSGFGKGIEVLMKDLPLK